MSLFVFDGKGRLPMPKMATENLTCSCACVMDLQRKGLQVAESWEQGDWSTGRLHIGS